MYLFLFLTPFGVGGEMIKKLIVEYFASELRTFTPEIIFNMLYLLINVIIFSVFKEYFAHK